MSIQNQFNLYGNESINKIRARLASSRANASGKASRSLRHIATDDELTIIGAGHFQWIEVGRRGGRTPKNFTDIIVKWMKDKGIKPRANTEQAYRTAAFFIARKIKQQGTLLYRTKTARDVFTSVINEESVNKLIESIATIKTSDIRSDIIRQFQQ